MSARAPSRVCLALPPCGVTRHTLPTDHLIRVSSMSLYSPPGPPWSGHGVCTISRTKGEVLVQETIYERGKQTAETAREKLSGAVDYFKQNDVRAITNDFKGYLQTHPTQALIGAVVLGFLAGRAIRRT